MIFMPMFSPVVAAGVVKMIAGPGPGPSGAGYSGDADLFGSTFGTMSGQPLVGETLVVLFYNGGSSFLVFSGDAVSSLAGKSLIVDEISYPLASADTPPTFDFPAPGYSGTSWGLDTGPAFVDGVSYTVRIE